MNRYRLVHITEFQYDGPVSESYNEVRLRPIQDVTQNCLSFRLNLKPAGKVNAYKDAFGNWVHQFNVLGEHRKLRVEADSVVVVHEPEPPNPLPLPLSDLETLRDDLNEEHYDFLAPSSYIPESDYLRDLAKAVENACDGSILGFANTASDLIHKRFRYEKGATHVHSSILDSLQTGAGVCQDFAHILIGVARTQGLPARYVSGYLVPRRTAEPGANVEEVIGGQASHAWAEVFVPSSGWLAFDPTLGQPVRVRHIRIGYGRDYGDVAPVRGVYKGHAGQRLAVDVRVRPALDDEGREHLQETAAGPLEAPPLHEPPQQQQHQQQQ